MNPIRDHVSCEDFVESVTAYWEDRLTGPARDRFEEHYLVCPPCRSYAGQLRLTTSLLARLEDDGARPGPEPADSAPPEPTTRSGRAPTSRRSRSSTPARSRRSPACRGRARTGPWPAGG